MNEEFPLKKDLQSGLNQEVQKKDYDYLISRLRNIKLRISLIEEKFFK